MAENKIEEILRDYYDSTARIDEITEVNTYFIDILNSLRSLQKITHPTTGADAIANQIQHLKNIETNRDLSQKLPIIYEQQLILYITAYEVLISELIKEIANNYRRVIDSSKFEGKKIDYEIFNHEEADIGDVIYSLIIQDKLSLKTLGSLEGIFSKYFKINLEIDKAAAKVFNRQNKIRDLILHSGGKIHHKFSDDPLFKSEKLKVGQHIIVAKNDIEELRQASFSIIDTIINSIRSRVKEEYALKE